MKLNNSDTPTSSNFFLKNTNSIPLSYINVPTELSKLTPIFSLFTQSSNCFS